MARPRPAAPANRGDRRKVRTREALIDAAVTLIAAGRGERASIQLITETADVGFGSFYNHFESKEQLFQTASERLLEQWGRAIDVACEGMTDPAEIFAVSFRISGRLGWTNQPMARFLVGCGLDLAQSDLGLAPRALRDIKAGQASGRFTIGNADVALSTAAGALLGLLRLRLARQRGLRADAVDDVAAALLRMLGVAPDESARLVSLPLPDVGGAVTG
jgi:AcrR family transcriptional regulator